MASDKCACGVRHKTHSRKARRNQLPCTGVKTDRYGYPRPGHGRRVGKDDKQRSGQIEL